MRVRTCKAACIPAFVLLLSVVAHIPARAQAWPNGYSSRRTVTIDHTKVPNTDQSNFPLLLSGTYSFLATTSNGGGVANSNGYDITFASDVYGLNVLPFEQESYNATTGAVIYWVQVPTVSHTADTVIYLFYGNSSVTTDQSNKTGVWDNNYKGIWHLSNGSTLSGADSSSGGSTLTNNNSTSATTGQIDGAASFNGSNNYLSSSSFGSIAAGSSITISFWNYVTSAELQSSAGFTVGGSDNPNRISAHAPWSDKILYWDYGSYNGGGRVSTDYTSYLGSWTYVVLEYNSANTTHSIYFNGSLAASNVNSNVPTSAATGIDIGAWPQQSLYDHASIDEFRVSTTARSADWIATEYTNQSSPSTFYSTGTATSYTGPSISSLSPTSGNLGSSVTITGTNFGSSQGSSTVTFAGTSATTTSWSSTQIIATVPTGILSGNVIVTVASQPSNSVRFTVTGGSWSNGYGYQRSVTIDHTKIPNTDQANFPLLFSGRYPYLATTSNGGGVTNSNGYDIIFALDAAGTRILSFEKESYDPSTGTINYWVQIPSLSHAYDTVIFLFYGNSSITTDQSNKNGTWDSNYKGVWHFNQTPNGSGSELDSTSNGYNGTPASSGISLSSDGVAGASLKFDGVSNSNGVAISSSTPGGPPVTASLWIKTTGLNSNAQSIIIDKEQWATAGWGIDDNGQYDPHVFFRTLPNPNTLVNIPRSSVNDGAWHYLVGTVDSSNHLDFYLDGSLYGTVTPSSVTANSAGALTVGGFGGNSGGGLLTEVHASNTVRSADWIATEYSNQASPWLFYDEGSPAILSLSPSTGYFGTSVTISGRHFGSSQGTSTVTFNGTAATVTSWSDTSILVTVPLGATSGNVVVTVASIPSRGFNFTVFPTAWSDQDIGSVGKTGSASFGKDTFTLTGDGSQLWNTADAFNFAYQSLSGDGTIIARLVTLQGSGLQQAGVMIRETLTAGSTYAAVEYGNNGSGGYYPSIMWRTSTGGSTSGQHNSGDTESLPLWMKLVRASSTFTAYESTNGVDWTQLGSSVGITMATSVYVGLFANSGDTSTLGTATFDNVSVTTPSSPGPLITSISATTGSIGSQVVIGGSGFGTTQGSGVVLLNGSLVTINSWSATSITITIPSGATSGYLVVSVAPDMDSNAVFFTLTSQPLPSPWLDSDVGSVTLRGSATYTGGIFTVKGEGVGIGGTADGLHFVYQPWYGDGVIVAQITSFPSLSNSASAGVMIRETLAAGATHADVDRTNDGAGYYYSYLTYRTTTGGSTSSQQGGAAQNLPVWLKMVRSGNTFTGYSSTDGVNWTQTGTSQTISMASNVDIGLVVASSSTGTMETATFDHVEVLSTSSSSLGVLSGTITNASGGAAISGASVRAMQQGVVEGADTSDVNGNYLIYLRAGPYDIETSASGFGTSLNNGTPMIANSTTTLNVSLSAPGSISGTVTQTNGVTPISGATVQALVGYALVASVTTASNGTYTLSGLNGGNYQVQASASGYVSNTQSASVTANGNATSNFSLQAQSTGAVTYVYDAVGRLVGVINPSGNTAIYAYDAVGNVLSTTQQSSTQLSFISFTPGSGPVGAAVTIYGTGFNSTPSQNTVKFNGVVATVTSASPTQLTVAVPLRATTGPVSITTSAGTVTSNNSFAVMP